jgi:hypothetical protein
MLQNLLCQMFRVGDKVRRRLGHCSLVSELAEGGGISQFMFQQSRRGTTSEERLVIQWVDVYMRVGKGTVIEVGVVASAVGSLV